MTDPLVEVVCARGHEHVSATHASTFEVTTDDWLTPAGDCILAVEADRAPRDFFARVSRRVCDDRRDDHGDDHRGGTGSNPH